MGRIEKTVFVSYRRTDEAWAVAVFGDLTHNGYDVFIDYDAIASGNFEAAILENIKARAHFLVLLTPTALERCSDPKDWMRREIEVALDSKRNIVPLMFDGFDFGTSATAGQLTGKLAALKEYNGISIPAGVFFSDAMGRLRNKFLNVTVDAILHPASDSAQQVAKEQKDKAMMAAEALHRAEKERRQEEPLAQYRAPETARRKLPAAWPFALTHWPSILVGGIAGATPLTLFFIIVEAPASQYVAVWLIICAAYGASVGFMQNRFGIWTSIAIASVPAFLIQFIALFFILVFDAARDRLLLGFIYSISATAGATISIAAGLGLLKWRATGRRPISAP
jgi:hypothetical protein